MFRQKLNDASAISLKNTVSNLKNETIDALYKIIYDSRLVNCPVDNVKYTFINDNCYFFETTRLNHSEASKNCLNKFGGRSGLLFEPKDTNINNEVYLKSKEAKSGKQHWWLGVVRSSDGEKFQYQSTAEIVPFSKSDHPWGNGQPGIGNGEDCVQTYYGTEKWHDYPCSTKSRSICQSV